MIYYREEPVGVVGTYKVTKTYTVTVYADREDELDCAIEDAKISEDDFRRVQAKVLAIPFVDLKKEKLEFSVLSLIPEPIARNHNIVAYKKGADSLEVAMLDPSDLAAIDFVKKKVELKILPRLTDGESMKSALLQYQKSLKAEFGDLIQKIAGFFQMFFGRFFIGIFFPQQKTRLVFRQFFHEAQFAVTGEKRDDVAQCRDFVLDELGQLLRLVVGGLLQRPLAQRPALPAFLQGHVHRLPRPLS